MTNSGFFEKFQRTSLVDFMIEPENNWWFRVGSLTLFDFLKPQL
jgi:hypothetical protein